MDKTILPLTLFLLLLLPFSCSRQEVTPFTMNLETLTMENGLQVVMQRDTTDPFVAVAVHYNAGPANETAQTSGYANLLMSIMSEQSSNVPPGRWTAFAKEMHGTSGSEITLDGTVFHSVVSRNALETILWMEADRMFRMQPVLNPETIRHHKAQVIENRISTIDEQPYGYTYDVIHEHLFPDGHPYSNPMTGSSSSILNATADELRGYHEAWFNPSRAVLSISGDFHPVELRKLISRYFNKQSAGSHALPPEPAAENLSESVKVFHEDSLATFPYFTMAWPTVPMNHPDAPALALLAAAMQSRYDGYLHQIIAGEKKLSRRINVMEEHFARTGKFSVIIPGEPGTDHAEIEKSVLEAFREFDMSDLNSENLEPIRAALEINACKGIRSIYNRSRKLARYAVAGDASSLPMEINGLREVKARDILRVFDTYIRNKPYVQVSFIPPGTMATLPENSLRAKVDRWETINRNIETTQQLAQKTADTGYPSESEPHPGEEVGLTPVSVWQIEMDNGLKVIANENHEVPWVSYSIVIGGGHLAEDPSVAGIAYLMADLMHRGAGTQAEEAFQQRLRQLGITLDIRSGLENISINVTTLKRNFSESIRLLEPLLLSPSYSDEELALAKLRLTRFLERNQDDPGSLVFRKFTETVYNPASPYSIPAMGTTESVNSITLETLEDFHRRLIVPDMATISLSGAVSPETVSEALTSLESRWTAAGTSLPATTPAIFRGAAESSSIELTGTNLSVILAGKVFHPESYSDYQLFKFVNFALTGTPDAYLNRYLSESEPGLRGSSGLSINTDHATFMITLQGSGVEPVKGWRLLGELLTGFRTRFTKSEFESVRKEYSATLIKAYESPEEIRGILTEMQRHDLQPGYLAAELEMIREMDYTTFMEQSDKLLDPEMLVRVTAAPRKQPPSRNQGIPSQEILP